MSLGEAKEPLKQPRAGLGTAQGFITQLVQNDTRILDRCSIESIMPGAGLVVIHGAKCFRNPLELPLRIGFKESRAVLFNPRLNRRLNRCRRRRG